MPIIKFLKLKFNFLCEEKLDFLFEILCGVQFLQQFEQIFNLRFSNTAEKRSGECSA